MFNQRLLSCCRLLARKNHIYVCSWSANCSLVTWVNNRKFKTKRPRVIPRTEEYHIYCVSAFNCIYRLVNFCSNFITCCVKCCCDKGNIFTAVCKCDYRVSTSNFWWSKVVKLKERLRTCHLLINSNFNIRWLSNYPIPVFHVTCKYLHL